VAGWDDLSDKHRSMPCDERTFCCSDTALIELIRKSVFYIVACIVEWNPHQASLEMAVTSANEQLYKYTCAKFSKYYFIKSR
jgi:hypothetical protein